MNTQEAYEYMRIYLTRPGARQATDDEGCLYETEIYGELHRCAVGCLLSPAALRMVSKWNCGASDMLRMSDVAGADLDGVDTGFLEAAQAVHDDRRNWGKDGFDVGRLDRIVGEFGLEVVRDEVPEPVLV